MDPQLLFAIGGFCIAGGVFFFSLVRWIVSHMDQIKNELLTLRTNDLNHIHSELAELRKHFYANQAP